MPLATRRWEHLRWRFRGMHARCQQLNDAPTVRSTHGINCQRVDFQILHSYRYAEILAPDHLLVIVLYLIAKVRAREFLPCQERFIPEKRF